jgi:hypothetical protein
MTRRCIQIGTTIVQSDLCVATINFMRLPWGE